MSVNCLDRHLRLYAGTVALVWEGDEPGEGRSLTYSQVYDAVCRLANVLRGRGVVKGDRVTIYMPNMPEAAVAMLACARIGAIHSVVFAGFSPESLADRIRDCGSLVVITADEGVRGGRSIPLKANVDAALQHRESVRSVLVASRTGADIPMLAGRDHGYAELVAAASSDCPPEPMNAEDPLFILHTSGSTGKPKGVVHTTAGYLLWAAMTFEYLFYHRSGDVFWCTADIGWITGHTYMVYGPLANGGTSVMFDGVPTHPDPGRFWETCDRLGVTILYTAPTVLRALTASRGDVAQARFRDKADVRRRSRDPRRRGARAGRPFDRHLVPRCELAGTGPEDLGRSGSLLRNLLRHVSGQVLHG